MNKLFNLDYKKDKKYVFLTTITCLIGGLLIAYLPFVLYNKTLIWGMDGLHQHATFFEYFMTRNGVRDIGSFDFKIGFGSDYFFSFAYYMILDPFNIIFYISPIRNIKFIYSFIVVLKLACVYLAMFFFLKHKKVRPLFANVGALVYMLCGISLFAIPRHPMFATGLIYLPLVIWGIENILEGKRPYLMIVSIFFACMSNYYQFALISIMAVIYAVIYYFQMNIERQVKFNFKNFALTFIKLGLYYLLGILLCGFLLLPIGYGMLHSARGSSKGILRPSFRMYYTTLSTYLFPGENYNFTTIGLNLFIILLAMYRVFKRRDAYSIGLIVLTALTFSILFGYITNLFNYYAGRWMFAYAFYAIFVSITTLEEICQERANEGIAKRSMRTLYYYLTLLIGTALIYYSGRVLNLLNVNNIVSTIIIFVLFILLIVTIINVRKFKPIKNFIKIYSPKILVLGLVICTLSVAFIYNFAYQFSFVTSKKYNSLVTSEEQFVSNQNKDKFYRTEIHGMEDDVNNSSLNNNYMSTSSYNSCSNGSVYDFLQAVGLNTPIGTVGISTLDQRVSINSLLNVNYYIDYKDKHMYGFTNTKQDNVYANSNTLEFGTVFRNTVSKKYFETLPMAERNNLLLEAIVLDDVESEYKYTSKTHELPYSVNLHNCEIKDNTIYADKNAYIEFRVENCANQELYIDLADFKHDFFSRDTAFSTIVCGADAKTIEICDDTNTFTLNLNVKGDNLYFALDNIVHNLGYQTNSNHSFKLKLTKGTYKYSSIKMYGYDMSHYQANIDSLKANEHFELSTFTNNKIVGNIDMNSSGYLFMSVPYSKGWKATVDGKETEIIKADYGFMALNLTEGSHTITLEYSTPLLTAGYTTSLLALTTLAVLVLVEEIYRHRKRKIHG